MTANPDNPQSDDLSALAWVHSELRRSLENAHKSLRRYLKETELVGRSDVDAADPSMLRGARSQLHQGVGALELVGMAGPARVLRAAEAAVQRLLTKPALVDEAAVLIIERTSFALLDYLGRVLAGKKMSALALFPQYRDAQTLAGAERVHPADLWEQDWLWHDLHGDASVPPRAADDAARGTMETLVLRLMRQPDATLWARMSDFCAGLGAGTHDRTSTLWKLAAAFTEAQAVGLLDSDIHSKRIASRLLAQLRGSVRSNEEPSDRLAQDLLFFCAHSKPPSAATPAPRLAEVRHVWRIEDEVPIDYETVRLGRFDPAWIAQARKRVAGAKDVWSAVAGGELHRLAGLAEQFSLLGDSLQRLFPRGDELAQSLQAAASRVLADGDSPTPALAMEVATSVLYLDATLEDGELDHPELAGRIGRMAQRIDEVRGGTPAQPLETWMEELYRRVSDRQTMGSVVQELRASLSEVEKQIDQYFRNPAQREVLIPVPNQLSAMRGVLSVLGMDQASAAVLHMRDDVDALASTEVDPQMALRAGTFDRLADNMGALSFLIDMLSVQPQLAKSLFRYDAGQGTLSAVMGQSARTSAFAALDEIEAAPPSVVEDTLALEPTLRQPRSADYDRTLRLDMPAEPAAAPAPATLPGGPVTFDLGPAMAPPAPAPLPPVEAARPAAAPAAAVGTGLEDDAEMREVFIEEAREVIESANVALANLVEQTGDVGELTTIRRAFHTLKGSSRMVGLRDYGEAAWACEQLYNARLAQAPRLDPALRDFTHEALQYLGGWTEAEAAGSAGGYSSPPVVKAADALRLQGLRLPIESVVATAQVAEAPPVVEVPRVLELPPAVVEAPAPEPAAVPVAALVEPTIRLPELSFDDAPTLALPRRDEPELPPAEVPTLVSLVPDLPSAVDLDLPPLVVPPAPEPVPEPVSEVSFELDLGEGPLEPQADLPAQPEVAEVIDLDFGVFEEQVAEAAAQEAVAAPPAPEEPLDLLDLDIGAAPTAPPELPVLPALPVLDAVVPDDEVITPLPVMLTEVVEDIGIGEPAPAETAEAIAEEVEDEQVKVIGSLRIAIPLFNIYLNEADELSRRLVVELAEWGLEFDRREVPESTIALAHSLAGNSGTVGYTDLSELARALEHALIRSRVIGHGSAGEPELFSEAADEIRRLLHQFAAGFLRPMTPGLVERLAEHERGLAEIVAGEGDEYRDSADADEAPLPNVFDTVALQGVAPQTTTFSALEPVPSLASVPAGVRGHGFDDDEDIDAVDAIDGELFPIFEEEAEELLPQLQSRLREWMLRPSDRAAASACMRTLHTFKGGARLAGAMRLGEMAHRLETAIERLAAEDEVAAERVERLLARADSMAAAFDVLRRPPSAAVAVAEPAVVAQPVAVAIPVQAVPAVIEPAAPEGLPLAEPVPEAGATAMPAAAVADAGAIDWSRFGDSAAGPVRAAEAQPVAGSGAVRVRSGLLDRLVNHAGEVSITRARIDTDVRLLQSSLNDLTDNLDRLRRQLRDIEVQAESQITSRMEAAKAAAQAFDPLEMDRFTRFQELTRMMAESVNDVATVQRTVQRTLQSTEDELASQARLTRELQDDLLRTRMVEFESLADRLYRVVRQAAKDTGKQVRLDIVGGAIEVDRGVLERMVGPFEHLLRNCVAHGIEMPDRRSEAGKDPVGTVTMSVTQEGNEVAVEVRDDGGGLDLVRIRQRAEERGLITPDQAATDGELANLIFAPGFSTATEVTELAGRGVGLDVVRAEVSGMGGRIETGSSPGQGTRFRLLLPLTTAVTQVVMLRCGELRVAVPSTLIEVVRRVPTDEVERSYASGAFAFGNETLPFYWLGALLQGESRGPAAGRSQAIVIVRSAAQRVALHVDEVLGNQEVVVKHVGPQLSRLPGLAGVTLLPSGAIALIYNPVALAALYGEKARLRAAEPAQPTQRQAVEEPLVQRAALVLVVDDSLTVRRVTQRLLTREGYRVTLAKDGMDALERLAEERPAVMLSDIEMPRMDGFDLVRNVRADPKYASLPVIMITSRIAQKHRDYAAELGVEHYLGKPFSEDELLSLVARYAGADITV